MDNIKTLVNLLINIVMGIVLGITGQIVNGGFSIVAFAQSFVLSMGSYIPIMDIGIKFAHAIGCRKGIKEYIASTLVVAVAMVILITFCCVFVQTGTDVLKIFRKMIFPFMVVGIIAIELSLFWIMRLAEYILSKKKIEVKEKLYGSTDIKSHTV